MAILTQASSPVADSGKISIALWARVQQASLLAGTAAILAFGQRDNGPSVISVNSDGSINVLLWGAHDGYTYTSNRSVANGGDGVDVEHTITNILSAGAPAGVFTGDRWFWLGFSADMTGTSSMSIVDINEEGTYTIDEAPNIYRLVVNNTDYTLPVEGWPAGTILPGSAGIWPEDLNFPGWEFAINGFEFGIPVQSVDAAADFNGRVQFSNIQIWVGQALDFSNPSVYSKFVAPKTGGYVNGGTPVKPSVAAASFGTQTYLFTGGKNSFFTNRGTGGAFVKTGTVLDTSGASF